MTTWKTEVDGRVIGIGREVVDLIGSGHGTVTSPFENLVSIDYWEFLA
jgi:hypothetical protein